LQRSWRQFWVCRRYPTCVTSRDVARKANAVVIPLLRSVQGGRPVVREEVSAPALAGSAGAGGTGSGRHSTPSPRPLTEAAVAGGRVRLGAPGKRPFIDPALIVLKPDARKRPIHAYECGV
jgi:hypothetical protein